MKMNNSWTLFTGQAEDIFCGPCFVSLKCRRSMDLMTRKSQWRKLLSSVRPKER